MCACSRHPPRTDGTVLGEFSEATEQTEEHVDSLAFQAACTSLQGLTEDSCTQLAQPIRRAAGVDASSPLSSWIQIYLEVQAAAVAQTFPLTASRGIKSTRSFLQHFVSRSPQISRSLEEALPSSSVVHKLVAVKGHCHAENREQELAGE